MTQPGIPNEFALSTACYGGRLKSIEDQAFAAVGMGFRHVELGLLDQPVTFNGFADSRRETGIAVDSMVAGCLNPKSENMSGTLLGSPKAEERERALNSLRRHIRSAQSLDCPLVIVRGCAVENEKLQREAESLHSDLLEATNGQLERVQAEIGDFVARVQKRGQKQVEHLCRSLHTLRAEFPDTRLALEPGLHFNDILNFEAMEWALADLSRQDVAYWHDTGRIHQRQAAGLPGQGAWLEAFSERLAGVHLQDSTLEEAELPPGQGEVDFHMVLDSISGTAVRVVEVNPRHGRPEILASVQFLADMGF